MQKFGGSEPTENNDSRQEVHCEKRHDETREISSYRSCYDAGPSYRRLGGYCAGRNARIVAEGLIKDMSMRQRGEGATGRDSWNIYHSTAVGTAIAVSTICVSADEE
jgi:hypothetical protein